MKFGAEVPIVQQNGQPEFLSELGPELEQRGFESLWVPEHVVLFDAHASRYPYTPDGKMPMTSTTGMLDPFVSLSYVAAHTRTLRLGTGICVVPQRNPVYTARQVADLDVLSNGRFEFGVGLGWLREEFEALGVPFACRGERTDAYLDVMVTLWTDSVSSCDGPMYTLPSSRFYPKPKQQPHPPIHVGGESDAALRRVAARGQGWFALNRTPEDLPDALARLDVALDAAGRKRSDVSISVGPRTSGARPLNREMLDRFEQLGVDRLIYPVLAFARDDLERQLDCIANAF